MSKKRIALVTGASRGIGAATAIEFARRGYSVTITARSADALDDVAGKIRQTGGEPLIRPGDLADFDFAQSLIKETVSHFGRLDVLVNNAAWRDLVTMRNITLESWERTLRICLTAPAFMSRWAAEQMEQQNGGVIINVSSLASERADGLSPAYIACKGALNSLTYELASLYGSKGIRVVSIRPGAIATEMAGDYQDAQGSNLTQELRKNWEESIPLKRMGSPEEIAKTIVWLSDDQASYITGTSLLVDGGWEHNLSPYRLKHLQYPKEFL